MKRFSIFLLSMLLTCQVKAETPFPLSDESATYCLSIAGQYKGYNRTTPYNLLLRHVNEIEMTTTDLSPVAFWLAAGRRDGKLFKFCKAQYGKDKAAIKTCPEQTVYPDRFRECKKFLGR